MKFGPFDQQDVPQIEAALGRAELRFETTTEESSIFIDVNDEDLEKIDPDLEKLGISLGLPVPDFHNTDFVCPKCEESYEKAGACPKDGERLLEFSAFAELKRKASGPDSRIFVICVLIVAALTAAFLFMS